MLTGRYCIIGILPCENIDESVWTNIISICTNSLRESVGVYEIKIPRHFMGNLHRLQKRWALFEPLYIAIKRQTINHFRLTSTWTVWSFVGVSHNTCSRLVLCIIGFNAWVTCAKLNPLSVMSVSWPEYLSICVLNIIDYVHSRVIQFVRMSVYREITQPFDYKQPLLNLS